MKKVLLFCANFFLLPNMSHVFVLSEYSENAGVLPKLLSLHADPGDTLVDVTYACTIQERMRIVMHIWWETLCQNKSWIWRLTAFYCCDSTSSRELSIHLVETPDINAQLAVWDNFFIVASIESYTSLKIGIIGWVNPQERKWERTYSRSKLKQKTRLKLNLYMLTCHRSFIWCVGKVIWARPRLFVAAQILTYRKTTVGKTS